LDSGIGPIWYVAYSALFTFTSRCKSANRSLAGVPANFWDKISPSDALTVEETALLDKSAKERARLGEETKLCNDMLQLIELTWKRRDAAISGGKATKDLCGYDYRLDHVGHLDSFVAFVATTDGKAAFQSGKLEAPTRSADDGGEDDNPEPALKGMCARKKCKTHLGWNVMLAKSVRRQIRELATQAKERKEAEDRVRDSAAARYKRKLSEKNWVSVVESGDSDEDAMDEG
jgi:COMPASS component SPP1